MLLVKPGERAKKRPERKPCPACIACDGTSIQMDAPMCGKCRDTMKKRADAKKPLRGQRWLDTERARRGC